MSLGMICFASSFTDPVLMSRFVWFVAVANTDGDVEERYNYDVFGRPDTQSGVGNPYMFTGRRYNKGFGKR